MTLDECAKRLEVPEEELSRIAAEVNASVQPRWRAMPEYLRSPCREMHERQKRGLPPHRRPDGP